MLSLFDSVLATLAVLCVIDGIYLLVLTVKHPAAKGRKTLRGLTAISYGLFGLLMVLWLIPALAAPNLVSAGWILRGALLVGMIIGRVDSRLDGVNQH